MKNIFIILFFILYVSCGCIKDNGERLHVSFIFLPLRGHTNPILGLAEELADQGCYVTFPISENKVDWVNKNGIHPLPIKLLEGELDDMSLNQRKEISKRDPGILGFFQSITQMFKSTLMDDFANIQRPLLRYPLEEYKKGNYNPDIIITEKMCITGSDLAYVFNVPFVYFQPSLIQDGLTFDYIPAFGSGLPIKMTQTQRLVNKLTNSIPMHQVLALVATPFFELRDEFGITNKVPNEFALERHDTIEIVATCFGFDYARPIYPTTKLVGPLIPKQLSSIPPNILEWIESSPSDVVYMCMGTMAAITTEMTEKIINGLGDKEYRILWSLPKSQLEVIEGLTIPSNFHIEHFVPQRELLMHKQVKGFFSHTGASSANEAILAEVPVVCMPFFADQFDFCQRLVYISAGIYVDKTSFTPEEIAENIHKILYDNEIKQAIKRAKELLQCGGAKAAADIVFDIYDNGCDYLLPPLENLHGIQRSGLDVKLFEWSIVIILFLVLLISLRISICFISCLCCRRKTSKVKQE